MNAFEVGQPVRQAARRAVSSRRRGSQKGSAFVELGICFISFILLTVGTLDFGMAVYASNFCYYSARDATRWATVHGSNSATSTSCSGSPGMASGCAANATDISNYVVNEAVALKASGMAASGTAGCLTNGYLTVCTTWTPDTTPGSEVNIKVSYLVVPVSGLALKQNLSVSSSSQMEMVH